MGAWNSAKRFCAVERGRKYEYKTLSLFLIFVEETVQKENGTVYDNYKPVFCSLSWIGYSFCRINGGQQWSCEWTLNRVYFYHIGNV